MVAVNQEVALAKNQFRLQLRERAGDFMRIACPRKSPCVSAVCILDLFWRRC